MATRDGYDEALAREANRLTRESRKHRRIERTHGHRVGRGVDSGCARCALRVRPARGAR